MASVPVNKMERVGVDRRMWSGGLGQRDRSSESFHLRDVNVTAPTLDGCGFLWTGRADWEEFRKRGKHYGWRKRDASRLDVGRVGITRIWRGISVRCMAWMWAEGMIAYARKHMPSNVALSVSDG